MFPFFNLFMLPLTDNTCSHFQQPPYSIQQTYQVSEEEMREKRAEAARSFENKKINGNFTYLQEQLCATYPKNKYSNKLKVRKIQNNDDDNKCKPTTPYKFNFSSILLTPFGKATIRFIWCPKQQRHNRFVVCGKDCTYDAITKKLDETYTDKQDRINIWREIFNYLTLPPVIKTDPWKYPNLNRLSKYEDKNLANLCAILAVCDPCFGENENGGKDVRALFKNPYDPSQLLNACDFSFKNFANVNFNPAAVKGAYKIYRISTDSEVLIRLNRDKASTIKSILINQTSKHTPIKTSPQSKLQQDKKPKSYVSPKKSVKIKSNPRSRINELTHSTFKPLDFS